MYSLVIHTSCYPTYLAKFLHQRAIGQNEIKVKHALKVRYSSTHPKQSWQLPSPVKGWFKILASPLVLQFSSAASPVNSEASDVASIITEVIHSVITGNYEVPDVFPSVLFLLTKYCSYFFTLFFNTLAKDQFVDSSEYRQFVYQALRLPQAQTLLLQASQI